MRTKHCQIELFIVSILDIAATPLRTWRACEPTRAGKKCSEVYTAHGMRLRAPRARCDVIAMHVQIVPLHQRHFLTRTCLLLHCVSIIDSSVAHTMKERKTNTDMHSNESVARASVAVQRLPQYHRCGVADARTDAGGCRTRRKRA